ncbi:UbiD family decarboxylase [Saccharibacillus sp. CPCC 101409]|uniref:UbiD family decarboxylase n=1 Tax=Saccharibacillus sp. CPCC 101409 TaxID=3058041 RepID=UPI0026717CE2|nr:UbiD family decarboxylase [Saccharibacillus sp. CPCC 101409]MDO3413078.1 UbiD family decarboxylase [Saccharibacillus sp. CPCC 101409]
MRYRSMQECVADLEKNGHLVRITEEVDPELEMAAIHLRTFEAEGPALYFENVKGSKYGAVSNLFGTVERSKFIFRDTWESTQEVIGLRNDPMQALKHPFRYVGTGLAARKALPIKKSGLPAGFEEIRISDLPMVKSWPKDGGAFVTLPQVYSEDPDKPGVMNANLGMYRMQLSGNEYEQDREVGLHYQIHRGIGVHQAKAAKRGQPLKVSCFIGGPPAHTLSAVMPLPEGLSELIFAGLLAGRHFRYSYADGYCVSHDADFVITGEIYPDETKPEGPFGDHLGYYSLVHEFPVMRVHKVYARKGALFPFTVVGRPPQEDTAFGALIHELTGGAVKQEIPGVKEVHAVDAAGVHPLLLAVGSERYTPYRAVKRPAELLTIANRILGTGQLSLAKYLWITAEDDGPVDAHDIAGLFTHILERIDLRRDLHFQTNTTIDTLDYSGTGLNSGSKVIFAAVGKPARTLSADVPAGLTQLPDGFGAPAMALPGIALLEGPAFTNYARAAEEIGELSAALARQGSLDGCPLIVLCDDSSFMSAAFDNFLWAAFTRSNPSHDIHGVNASVEYKHWGCDNIIIDARTKPHQAPALVPDPEVAEHIGRLFAPGGSLEKVGRPVR